MSRSVIGTPSKSSGGRRGAEYEPRGGIRTAPMHASQLLDVRRGDDAGVDLWNTLNRVQENLIRGGLTRRTATGRLTRMRGITAIRRDVEPNSRLLDLAAEVLAA
jgi:hypothetical protein